MNDNKINPLVSVIISCFNHEKFVDDCLDSLCNQTYDNIEVLITDDCSSDNSFLVIKKWEERLRKRFVRLNIVRNETNQGYVKNLNRMITASNGTFIKDLSSDDFLPKDAILDLVEYALSTEADVVFSNCYIVNENDKYDNLHTPLKVWYKKGHLPLQGKNLTSDLCSSCFICAPTTLVPKKTYEKYGLYSEEFSFEDLDFWLRVSVAGRIEYLDKVTVYYRVRTQSLSHFLSSAKDFERQRKYYEEKRRIISQYDKFLKKEGEKVFYNNEYSAAIALGNVGLVRDIETAMRKLNLKKTFLNQVRKYLYRVHLYQIARKFKMMMVKMFER